MRNRATQENRLQLFKYQDEGSPVQERKFGMPVNRSFLKSQSPIKELEDFDTDYNLCNKNKIQKSVSFAQKYTPQDQCSLASNSSRRPEEQAKGLNDEKNYRMRNFQNRVDRIDHINEQINGLFEYVKKSETRSATKIQKQKNNQSAASQRISQILSKKDLSAIEKSPIKMATPYENKTPIKPRDFSIKDDELSYQRKYGYSPIQRRQKETILRDKIDQEESDFLRKMKQEKTAISSITKKIPQRSYERSLNQPPIHIPTAKVPYPPLKNEENIKNRTPTKRYEYQFDSNNQESLSENRDLSQKRNIEQIRVEKKNKIVDDYQNQSTKIKARGQEQATSGQLDRIRKRIASSEKRTLQMQRRLRRGKQGYNDSYKKLEADLDEIYESKIIQKPECMNEGNKKSEVYRPASNLDINQFKINVLPVPYQGVIESERTHKKIQLQLSDKMQMNERLAKSLSEQIKLDKLLKEARGQFHELKERMKWRELKKILNSRGFPYTEEQLEKQLQISSNQFDPFISEDNSKITNQIENLANCFIKSQQFWDQKVTGVISRKQAEQCKFSVKEIDLNSKGHLNIQDLVCFINLYANTFYRNRDVMTLFRRFMASSSLRQGIDMQSFLKKIVK